MKIYLTAIIKSKEEHQAEVLEVLQTMVTETRKEEANELYSLHQGIEDRNQFVFYEIWKNEEGLAQHNQQPYIQAFGAIVDEKLQEKPQIYITHIL
ncbi:putative quinol monooxygenase [Chryseobacterium indologenes]|uniref:Antibiotic biosynthesis monooxygenase n=1 Tax=Chryseobacterium indologenes TaxID=253 RepID=A0A0N1KTD1_CHRID|nr:putative quinol monooxygenase [Chryseobacterium indologenes]KPE50250.1 antibiotic biosynthesis monooxygenase [Chryseobacterium indologenes]